MQNLIFLYFMLIFIIKYINFLLKSFKNQLKFIKELKKKEIFNLNFSDELKLLENRLNLKFNWLTNYFFRKILTKKFTKQLKKISYQPKILSGINSAIEKVFSLETNEAFKKEILKITLKYRVKILNEVRRFNKLHKAYVLDKLFKFFNGECEFFAFSNDLNLLVYKRAGAFAFWTKKAILPEILDKIQKKNVKLLAA